MKIYFKAPLDFAEHLSKSNVSENNKVYYGRFSTGNVKLVKVDKIYNIFKNLLAIGYWSRHE